MKTYLCGGINGLSDSDCKDWRETAKSLLNTSTLDPMRRDFRGREDECMNDIVLGDMEDIADSQFLLVNATKPSWGTAMEIVYANRKNIPVAAFINPGKVSPWLRFHCTFISNTLEGAISAINTWAKACMPAVA